MPALWSSEVSKAILKKLKVERGDSGYVLQFLKKLKVYTQN